VIAEAERLAQIGVREITLIGQDTTCYGERFRTERWSGAPAGKTGANWKICVGFVSSMPIPTKITGSFWRRLGTHEKICSYMDVPLQHASATVLKRMKRGGGAEVFLRSIARMRRAIPGVTLRTSFIVGFSGRDRAGIR